MTDATPRNPTEPVHEYAGFRYRMLLDAYGRAIAAHALAGQHPAAVKGKHLRAAVDTYNQEYDL